jgi:hypothetical protein
LIGSVFRPLPRAQIWQPDCDNKLRFSNSLQASAMLGELTNIPTDTLIDMLYIILAGDVAISASDAEEIEQIQRELQRRGDAQSWSLGTVN